MKTFKPPAPSPWIAWFSAALAGGLLLWLMARLQGPDRFTPGHRTLLRHVAVYEPGRGGVRRDRDLLWEDGRIVAIAEGGSLAAEGGLVLEGRGLYALPTLADAAVFLSMEGNIPGNSVAADARQSLRQQSSVGMGDVLDLNANRVFIRQTQTLTGLTRARFAGALFSAPDGWGLPGQAPWDGNRVDVQELDDLDAPWNRALRFSDEAIFVSVDSAGHDGLSIAPAILARLSALAHAQGLPLVLETHSARKAELALQAHPDAILGPLLDLDETPQLAAEMREARCAYIPALGSVLNAFPPETLDRWLRRFPATGTLGPRLLAQAQNAQDYALWAGTWGRQNTAPAKVLKAVKQLSDRGVSIVFGTGSGLPLVFHGLGAQIEMEQLSRAGLSPRQILDAAILGSRRLIGLPGGTLRPGAAADILLVAGDPEMDAGAALRPKKMFLDGLEVKP